MKTYPVFMSQILIVLSRLHDTSLSPEGKNAIDDTLWSWPEIRVSALDQKIAVTHLLEFWRIQTRQNPTIWLTSRPMMKLFIRLVQKFQKTD